VLSGVRADGAVGAIGAHDETTARTERARSMGKGTVAKRSACDQETRARRRPPRAATTETLRCFLRARPAALPEARVRRR
jgi:hypothetical protein